VGWVFCAILPPPPPIFVHFLQRGNFLSGGVTREKVDFTGPVVFCAYRCYFRVVFVLQLGDTIFHCSLYFWGHGAAIYSLFLFRFGGRSVYNPCRSKSQSK
jgi:hypothetical protein